MDTQVRSMIDHDRLFKELISTFFVEFIELFLPAVREYLDPHSLVFLDKELFTDVTAGERYEADLVVKARFKDEDAFFLIHVESQAQPQSGFGKRMFRYFARLHEKFDLPIYPIVLFTYDTPQNQEPDIYNVAFPDKVVLEFRYHVIQLNRLNWREFVQRPNPVASALMAKMNVAPADQQRVKLECLRMLVTLRLDPARMRLIAGFVATYLRLSAEAEKQVIAALSSLDAAGQEEVMEVVNSWVELGLQEGLQLGRQEGRQEGLQAGLELGRQEGLQEGLHVGQAQLILRLLARRFGEVDATLQQRIQMLSSERLEQLGEALLDFGQLADLEQWFQLNAPGCRGPGGSDGSGE